MVCDTDVWKRQAERLSIEIVAPFKLPFADTEVSFAALLPQFGAPKGMVVDRDWDALEPFADSLSEAGYGYSCVEPGHDLQSLKEMLADWGWSSDEPAPSWLREGS